MGQPQTIEARLKFTADTQGATREMKALEEQTKGVTREMREAQKEADRMRRAGGSGPPPLPGQGGGYGVAPAAGQSRAGAFAGGMAGGPPMPTYQPGAGAYAPAGRPGGGGPRPGMGGGDDLASGFMVAKVAAGLTVVVGALDNFAKAVDRAATTTNALGSPVGGGRTAIDAAVGIPFLGSLGRAGGNLGDFAVNSEYGLGTFRDMVTTGRPERGLRSQAILDAQASERLVRRIGPESDMQRQFAENRTGLEESLWRRNVSDRAARTAGMGYGGPLAGVVGAVDRANPEFAGARRGVVRSRDDLEVAERMHRSAVGDSAMARQRVEEARFGVARTRNDVAPNTHWSNLASISPTASRLEQTDRNTVMAAELRLAEALKNQEAALNREKRAGIDLAQKKLEFGRSQLELSKAELAAVERNTARQEGFAADFAMMDPFAKRSLRQTLEKAKSGATLSQDELRELSGNNITAEAGRQFATKQGEGDPALFAINQLLGNMGLGQSRKLEMDLRQQITAKVELNEAETRKAIVDASAAIMPKLEQIAREALEQRFKVMEIERAQSQAQMN